MADTTIVKSFTSNTAATGYKVTESVQRPAVPAMAPGGKLY